MAAEPKLKNSVEDVQFDIMHKSVCGRGKSFELKNHHN